jgi:3-methyladenine DNA glycosylase AlkD
VEYTAAQFVERLRELRPPGAEDPDDCHGLAMGQIFGLARELQDMAPDEIERLLESPAHAVRVGAVSIMDFQARDRRRSSDRKRELFELYLRRHDRIDTWDLVDRSAIWVVGEYLVDKPRDVLDRLAASDRPMERRTAILATFAFIRRNELDDAYRIAETLVDDPEDTIHKAVGWMLREAGKRDAARQAAFLEAHAATMPRVMLRYAIEKLDKPDRDRWLGMKTAADAKTRDED